MINDKKVVTKAAPNMEFEISDHFPVRLIQREFDLSALIPLYGELCQAKIGQKVELSIGRATVIAVRTAIDRAKLITGWRGNRK